MTQIVQVGPADLPALCEWRLRFLAEERGTDVSELSSELADATSEFLGRGHSAGDQVSWFAASEGAIVGVVTMLIRAMAPRPDDLRNREGYVINLFVDQRHRSRGVGRQLLEALLAEAESLDLREVVLHATDLGRPLYESFGFSPSPSWMHMPLPAVHPGG